MIRYKVSPKFDKAADILTKWHFIYEETPHGNLMAEPMDFSINDRLICELGNAGYFSLSARRALVISVRNEDGLIWGM